MWRQMITASSFALTSPSPISNIAGFASLNYRLSTPPPVPQFQQFTQSGNLAHNVKHPIHVNVVVTFLNYLQKTYKFGEKYALVGHGCGANLTFKLPDGSELCRPAGMLGVGGVYDLGRLRDAPIEVPMYQYFVESAFGKDEEAWKLASPATHVSEADLAWRIAKVAALAKSDEDEHVDVNQRDIYGSN
jgi:hypothetical protein